MEPYRMIRHSPRLSAEVGSNQKRFQRWPRDFISLSTRPRFRDFTEQLFMVRRIDVTGLRVQSPGNTIEPHSLERRPVMDPRNTQGVIASQTVFQGRRQPMFGARAIQSGGAPREIEGLEVLVLVE